MGFELSPALITNVNLITMTMMMHNDDHDDDNYDDDKNHENDGDDNIEGNF